MCLVRKERTGSRVKKVYDQPRTPYRRLLESSDVDETAKDNLRTAYDALNPADLKRRIPRLQNKLFKIYVHKADVIRKEEPLPELLSTFPVRQ